MKKISVLLMTVLMSFIGIAQSTNFEAEMLKRIQQLEQRTAQTDMLQLSEAFESLAQENPKRYEAKYYTAYSLILNAYQEKKLEEKDKQLKKAKTIIDLAIEQEGNNAELYILKALCFQMMIDVNPKERGYKYSQKAEKELVKAFSIDDSNPRYYFLKGQNLFYTPEQYGGGKAKAKPYFAKAAKLFKKKKQENVLAPTWGQSTNAMQLKASKK